MTGMDVTIHEAENGREAIGLALRIRPDLIITDLNMPEMNGEELVARVRQTTELKGTPVLVLSADRSPARREQLKRAGAVAYLTKPVTPEVLKRYFTGIMEAAL
ncbi:MAG TPA: response regulator [Bryobacteraceae bacterium]|nr:response regulator [Bryobacteraceae bacterium]